MNSNNDIFNKIKASLDNARDVVKLKERIGSDISEVLSMISQITDDAVSFSIEKTTHDEIEYLSSDNIVYIYKASSPHINFIIFAYSIDEVMGYPVTIETKSNFYNCNDDTTLKTIVSDLIIEKETSMKIMKLISNDDDIPF